MSIKIENDGNRYIVSDDVTVVYGTGDTQVLSLLDYIVSMVEYCDITNHKLESEPILMATNAIQELLK